MIHPIQVDGCKGSVSIEDSDDINYTYFIVADFPACGFSVTAYITEDASYIYLPEAEHPGQLFVSNLQLELYAILFPKEKVH